MTFTHRSSLGIQIRRQFSEVEDKLFGQNWLAFFMILIQVREITPIMLIRTKIYRKENK